MRMNTKNLLIAGFLSPLMLFAETLNIEADGNYVFGERIELTDSSDAIYNVTGTLTLTGVLNDAESYIELGLVPFDGAGTSLQSIDSFSFPFDQNADGYMSIAMLPMSGNDSVTISKRIQLGGAELKQVSFVVGATLSDGAKVAVTDLKLTRVGEDISDAQTSSGISVGEGTSSASGLTIVVGKTGAVLAKDNLVDLIKEDTLSQKEISLLSNARRTIFVNADIGSDNFAGLKRGRGQADGPKKTIKSALGVLGAGDEIVLQESNEVYKLSTSIRAKPGQTLVIRPEGKVTIKGSN